MAAEDICKECGHTAFEHGEYGCDVHYIRDVKICLCPWKTNEGPYIFYIYQEDLCFYEKTPKYVRYRK